MTACLEEWHREGASSDAPVLYVELANTFFGRLVGLAGRRGLAPAHALLLLPCTGVHMCFMLFATDVVYLRRLEDGDTRWQVIRSAPSLRPWLGASVCIEADAALELCAGEAERLGLSAGTIWTRKKERIAV